MKFQVIGKILEIILLSIILLLVGIVFFHSSTSACILYANPYVATIDDLEIDFDNLQSRCDEVGNACLMKKDDYEESILYRSLHENTAYVMITKYLQDDDLIKGDEVLLVKGSQNTLFLEIIVEALMKDKTKASELPGRRGSFWEKKREALRV